jgi:hypothetical protein
MNTKDALYIAEKFIKSINKSKDEFLDNRLKEWALIIEANFVEESPDSHPNDPRSKERMALLKNITKEIATYSRRDFRMSAGFAQSRWDKLSRLDLLRKEDGIEPFEHPTILALKAELALLCKDFQSGKEYIEAAIAANEAFPFKTQERERIRLAFIMSRALYGCGLHQDAKSVADQAVSDAENYSSIKEETALAATCTKGVGSVPVAIYSLFAACDVRVNDLSWDKDEALKEEFTFFWNKSIVEHGAPNSWNPPLQIAVISDELWSKRLDDCVKKVAKECYVNLGNSDIDKFFRKAHSFWAGIPLELPSTVTARSAAGLLIIAVLSSSTIKLTEDFYVFDAIEPVAEVVEQETNGVITKSDAESYLRQSLREDARETIDQLSDIVEDEIDRAMRVRSQTRHMLIAHQGEGSAERI